MLAALRAQPNSFRALMKTGANGARLHPTYPHWYLETMGVDPAAQCKGIGRHLLEPVLEIADRDRVDCYLETADRANVDFYERQASSSRTAPCSWCRTARLTLRCGGVRGTYPRVSDGKG
jgi:ribosomal protein S18 acetylase RimI-like enzyme